MTPFTRTAMTGAVGGGAVLAGCASARGGRGDSGVVQFHTEAEAAEALAKLTDLIDVVVEMTATVNSRIAGIANDSAVDQANQAGRDAWNFSPVVSIAGSDAIVVAGAVVLAMAVLAVCVAALGRYARRSRTSIRAMAQAIEGSHAQSVKDEVCRRTLDAGVADWLHRRIQRDVNRSTRGFGRWVKRSLIDRIRPSQDGGSAGSDPADMQGGPPETPTGGPGGSRTT